MSRLKLVLEQRLLYAHLRRAVRSQGFTITEILVVLIVAGILAAIAGPSVAGFLGQQELDQATSEVQSAILEMQREAQRLNRTCTLKATDLVAGGINRDTTAAPTGNCLLRSRSFARNQITVAQNLSSNVLAYPSGNVYWTGNATQEIRLSSTLTPVQRCVVLARPLGLVRTGTVQSGSCRTSS
ncbi:pilus assembly FimT family protein [Synechococcus elongatus]|nr:pilin-like protein [Synechococcus elongatus PCC 7942 = FACHB-805]MBD2688300.1 type II secretion system protein [Synechococcus elongatus FACHB-1061]BAD79815.1 pilin-like protein [Synechococcus elongatus PCC 6301]